MSDPDTTCPNCQSTDTVDDTAVRILEDNRTETGDRHHCYDCGTEWVNWRGGETTMEGET